jgi:hypothetical protein
MTEHALSILIGVLIVVGIGFLLGLIHGRERSRLQCAEEKVDDLRNQLKHASMPAQLREIRSVINDAHKHILAVSKGLEKQPR